MFNPTLIKRSLAAGLLTAAAALPAAAQARYAADSGGVQSTSPVLTAGLPATASASPVGPTDASSGGYRFPSSAVLTAGLPATASASQVGPTDASSGGYRFPSSAVSATGQTGSSFHWGDAGIGAGSIVLLLGATGLGAVAMRRRRPQRTLVS